MVQVGVRLCLTIILSPVKYNTWHNRNYKDSLTEKWDVQRVPVPGLLQSALLLLFVEEWTADRATWSPKCGDYLTSGLGRGRQVGSLWPRVA